MKRTCRWNGRWLAAGLAVTGLLAAASLLCGRYEVTAEQLFLSIVSWTGLGEPAADQAKADMVSRVLFQIRLPRICYCLAAGAGLAAAGAAMQGVFANPLATPDTLGVANGASFGAALGILLGMDGFFIQITAMFFGMGAVGLVFLIGRRKEGNPVLMLVLSGMVISSLFAALLSLVKFVADPQDVLPAITHWLMGSLNGVTWQSVRLGLPWILTGSLVIWLLRWKLNALSLSEEEARSLGVPTRLVRLLTIGAASMVTAAVVAACGQIGWIGLLIPHCCRLLFGGDYRQITPASLCFGGAFLLIVDTIARSAAAAEIPAAILTAIIGAPVFLLLLQTKDGIRL